MDILAFRLHLFSSSTPLILINNYISYLLNPLLNKSINYQNAIINNKKGVNMENITDFRTRFPEFDNVTDDRINLFLADSELFVSEVWGDFRDIGIYYLTAHNLSIAEKTAQGATNGIQGIASKSVEGVSISYQSETTSESNAYYMSTSYGKRYLDIKMRLSKGNARLV